MHASKPLTDKKEKKANGGSSGVVKETGEPVGQENFCLMHKLTLIFISR